MPAQLSLKVHVADMGTTKTMQFPSDMSIHDACHDIRQKLGEGGGGVDHGLFWPEHLKWLAPGRTFEYYDMKSGENLDFKKRHRLLRVKTTDETLKTIIIDETLTVAELVMAICERIGIANPEEYSLMPELGASLGTAKEGTIKKKGAKEYEESRWLNPEKTLPEQHIKDNDALFLKKKFFFSDQNVDRNDPIQLNLLYNQSVNAIVVGEHPCTYDEACLFAAIQCQVQHGNHAPDKHKPGFLNLKEFVPEEYRRKKDVEKKIFQEHRKLQGMTELNGKFRYVQLCRSLKTYGVTFFEVKERDPKKNKMVSVLLGVTRESVLRMDAETKDILQTWPLTTLRRWAASPKTFTLDFGDYSDAYYSVQTAEGEAISQLIAGYIDIILKKKKEADRIFNDEEEEVAIAEESVRSAKATAIQMPSSRKGQAVDVKLARAGVVAGTTGFSSQKIGLGGSGPQRAQVSPAPAIPQVGRFSADVPRAQQVLLGAVGGGAAAMTTANADLAMATMLPPLSPDPISVAWRASSRHITCEGLLAYVAHHLASTCSIVNGTAGSPTDFDFATLGAEISSITTTSAQLTSGVKMVAGLQENESSGESLLEAARAVSMANAKFLNILQSAILGEGVRGDLLSAAQQVGTASLELLSQIDGYDVHPASHKALLDAAKAVVAATTGLIQSAKSVAKTLEPDKQAEIVVAIKECAAMASQLVACTGTISPAVFAPICQGKLAESALMMQDTLESLAQLAGESTEDSAVLEPLQNAAVNVNAAIAKLLDLVRLGGKPPLEGTRRLYDQVVASATTILGSMEDTQTFISASKELAEAGTEWIKQLRCQAGDEADVDVKNRLLGRARALADATAKFASSAKEAAKSPGDRERAVRLKENLAAVQASAAGVAGPEGQLQLCDRLLSAAKATYSALVCLVTATKAAGPVNSNQTSQLALTHAAKRATEAAGPLAVASRTCSADPEPGNVLRLVEAARAILAPGNAFVAAANSAHPSITDESAQLQLKTAILQAEDALKVIAAMQELADAASGNIGMDGAVRAVRSNLDDLKRSRAAQADARQAPAGFSIEAGQHDVGVAARSLASTISQLVSASLQGNDKYVGSAASGISSALQQLASNAKNIAAASKDAAMGDKVISAAISALEKSDALLVLGRASAEAPNNADAKQRLHGTAKDVSDALMRVMECLPGQKEVENAISLIGAATKAFAADAVPATATAKTFQAAQNDLNTASTVMNVAVSNLVVASRASAKDLQQSAKGIEVAFTKLLAAANAVLGHHTDVTARETVVSHVREVGLNGCKLLSAVKAVGMDPNAPNLKHQLAQSSKHVGDALEQLLQTCSAAAPGQGEANAATRALALAEAKLDAVNDPSTLSLGYANCVADVNESAAAVNAILQATPSAARSADVAKLCGFMTQIAEALQKVADRTVRAAFLIGLADPQTVAAVPGVVDQEKNGRASNDLREACEQLTGPSQLTQQQVLAQASIIAKQTSVLCASCKEYGNLSALTPGAQKQFADFGKQLAMATAGLVASIKTLATQPGPESKEKCAAAAAPLLGAVQALVMFSASPEFAPKPSAVTAATQVLQQQLVEESRSSLVTGRDLVGTLRSMCSNPRSPQYQALLAAQAKSIGDSLRSLVESMLASAPGQRECDDAIERISQNVAQADSVAVKLHAGTLEPGSMSEEGCRELLLGKLRDFILTADTVFRAAKVEASSIGSPVGQMATNFEQAIGAAVDMVRVNADRKLGAKILEDSRDLGEAALVFLQACRSAGAGGAEGGRPENAQNVVHGEIDRSREFVQAAVEKLQTTFEGAVEAAGEYNKVIKGIEQELYSFDLGGQQAATGTAGSESAFSQAVSEICSTSSKHGDIVAAMLSRKPDVPPEKAAASLGQSYNDVVAAAKKAVASSPDEKLSGGIIEAVRNLGGADIRLLDTLKIVQGRRDAASRQKPSAAGREVTLACTRLIAAAREATKGRKQCEEAAECVTAFSADLETAIIFAQAGQLDPIDPQDNFGKFNEPLLAATKELVNTTKNLVIAAASSEQLGEAASAAVQNLEQFKDGAKKAATSITSSDKQMQQVLLSGAKKVTDYMQEMLNVGVVAAGKPPTDPNVFKLRETAKCLAAAITQVFETIKLVGDESSRGARAIDGACADIDDMKARLNEPAHGTALPEEVAALAKTLAAAAAALVTAHKQEDVVSGTGVVRKQLESLIRAGQAATEQAPADRKQEMHDTLRKLADWVKHLLFTVKNGQNAADKRQAKSEVQASAKYVVLTVGEVVNLASSLIPGGYVDPNDPNVVAERELLAAAGAIEAAARKLAQLQPPAKPKAPDEEISFDAQILEATKSIAAAAGALVRNATSVQREIVAKGRAEVPAGQLYHADPAWSDGLVSAAKEVVQATRELCEAANMVVRGEDAAEHVLACTTNVGGATVRLLAAATARHGDINCQSEIRLKAAGKAVTNATEVLAAAARSYTRNDDQDLGKPETILGRTAQRALEMDAQVSVLKMEKELMKARSRLDHIRKSRYSDR